MDIFWELQRGSESKVLKHISRRFRIRRFDVNALNDSGQSLLHIAVLEGASDVARYLIDKGADLNPRDSRLGCTPLHYACEYHRVDIAEQLLDAGADPRVVDIHGNEPLWIACFRAYFAGSHALVELLVDRGGNPWHRNGTGKSPFDIAEEKGDSEMMSLLNSTGHNPSEMDSDIGEGRV